MWGDDLRDRAALDDYLTRDDGAGEEPDDMAPPPVDPWEVLRRLRARYLLDSTTGKEEISGADAITELCEIREELDRALDRAPPPPRT